MKINNFHSVYLKILEIGAESRAMLVHWVLGNAPYKNVKRKIPIISPGLTFIQKAFLADLIFRGDSFRSGLLLEGICVSKWVGLDNKKITA